MKIYYYSLGKKMVVVEVETMSLLPMLDSKLLLVSVVILFFIPQIKKDIIDIQHINHSF